MDMEHSQFFYLIGVQHESILIGVSDMIGEDEGMWISLLTFQHCHTLLKIKNAVGFYQARGGTN